MASINQLVKELYVSLLILFGYFIRLIVSLLEEQYSNIFIATECALEK